MERVDVQKGESTKKLISSQNSLTEKIKTDYHLHIFYYANVERVHEPPFKAVTSYAFFVAEESIKHQNDWSQSMSTLASYPPIVMKN